MEGRLRRRALVPVGVAIAAAIGLAAFAIVSRPAPGDPAGAKPTASQSASAFASPEACRPRFRRFPDDPGRAAWYTLEQQSDANGVLTGNVARVTRAGGGPVTAVELPSEAWADGPYDDGALVGSDDGLTSTLRFLAPHGCGRTLLSVTETVIRRATISPDGQRLFTFHLARGTREPAGIRVAPVADPTASQPLLGPIPPDDRFGITWGTGLHWSAEGDRLVVESCTPTGCRFQIADPVSGAETLIDDERLGDFVGLVGDRLFALADCIDYRPCPLLQRSVATGTISELHPGVDSATLVTIGGPRLIATVHDGSGPTLQVIDPDHSTASPLPLPALARGLTPVRNGANAGIGLPRGWLALAPDGQLPNGMGRGRLFAFNVDTSRLLLLVGGDS